MNTTIKASVTVTCTQAGGRNVDTFQIISRGADGIFLDTSFISDEVPACLYHDGMREMLAFWLVDGNAETGDTFEWVDTDSEGIQWADDIDPEHPTINTAITIQFNHVETTDS